MITIFEDSNALNFEPISLTRPVFDIRYGSMTLYERLKELSNNKITAFYSVRFLLLKNKSIKNS